MQAGQTSVGFSPHFDASLHSGDVLPSGQTAWSLAASTGLDGRKRGTNERVFARSAHVAVAFTIMRRGRPSCVASSHLPPVQSRTHRSERAKPKRTHLCPAPPCHAMPLPRVLRESLDTCAHRIHCVDERHPGVGVCIYVTRKPGCSNAREVQRRTQNRAASWLT